MIVLLVAGAGVGLGLWAVWWGVYPPRRPLSHVLSTGAPTAATAVLPGVGDVPVGWTGRVGRPAAGLLAGFGLPGGRVAADLAVVGRPVPQHLAEKATATVVGLCCGPAVAGIAQLAGTSLGWMVPGWLAVLTGLAGFFTPDVGVHAEAVRRRADFRHALSAFLDLVVISLAGGAGVDQALADAAGIGQGWAAIQLRRALRAAQLARTPPWVSLGQLGRELGIGELVELAAVVSLAGREGAKVRASLAAKAAALRAHQLADTETAAQAATERMSLPVVILFAGFLVFIGWPALQTVLGAL